MTRQNTFKSILAQYQTRYPTVSNDILETRARQAVNEIFRDPIVYLQSKGLV